MITLWAIRDHHRSRLCCQAMLDGAVVAGLSPQLKFESDWRGEVDETAVFYGLEGNLPAIFKAHVDAGAHAIYIDLGWWGRREGGRWAGFHKLVHNARHPNAYFQAVRHSPGRFARFGLSISPWREQGWHILLAGMGDKGARAEGFEPEQWERWAIGEIRKVTDRAIIYRPKPSWKEARPITGVGFSPVTQDLAREFEGCWAVVTHHSNVAVDALIAGIPAFCWAGIARGLASQEIADIERPLLPPLGREQMCYDAAWCQWNVAEMRNGRAWAYLAQEGLI